MGGLGKILGVLIAGSLATGDEVSDSDLGDVGLWHHAYKGCDGLGGTEGFLRVYHMAHTAVEGFFKRSQTREALYKLAHTLEMAQDIGRHALSTAMGLAGVGTLMEPGWRTILPPPQPLGKAMRVAQLSAERYAASTEAVTRRLREVRGKYGKGTQDAAVHASVIKALQSGDFHDASGKKYYPSQAEIVELHRVWGAYKRGEHVPGLP